MAKPKIAQISTGLSHSREREVGILNWVNEKNPGFEGILKQRYVGGALLMFGGIGSDEEFWR